MFNRDEQTEKPVSWKNKYLQQIRQLVKSIADSVPTEVQFPITFKRTMFEFGGDNKNFGSALIISDAKGYPSQGRLVHNPRANGLQAEVTIWPGCLVGVANHSLGKEVFAIYKIVETTEPEKRDSFGSAKAVRLAFVKSPSQHSGSSKSAWYDNIKDEYWCISNFVELLKNKLYTPNNIYPSYIEWFMNLKNPLVIRKQFYNLPLNWTSTGVYDSDAVSMPGSPTFEHLYESLVDRAIELNKTNRIVIAIFGHYLAKINENDAIEFLPQTPETYDNLSDDVTLVTEARLVYTNSYSPKLQLQADENVYTYIHTLNPSKCNRYYTPKKTDDNSEEQPKEVINPSYFVSDDTLHDFSVKHHRDCVNNIINRSIYSNIIRNIKNEPVTVTNKDGEQKEYTPLPKSHPDTRINVLLFIGSSHNFFTDIQNNFKKRSEQPVAEKNNEQPEVEQEVNAEEDQNQSLDMSGLEKFIHNHHS